jgi:CRISPR-associated protein Csb3
LLLSAISQLPLTQLNPEDHGASPLNISVGEGFRLDWWQDSGSDGQALKPWAGTQGGYRIAKAMQRAVPSANAERCLDFSAIIYDPVEPAKKVEPFYFDSRRGARPYSRDIGFAPDALQMTTLAFPAVEFLCLVGLQRCRPRPAPEPRVFDYFTWSEPLSVSVLPVAVSGLLPGIGAEGYRFESAYRTDQRKHKAFSPAIPLSRRSP